ncbi:hypothetical protein TRFO_18352 [Tritrichomonas foetus]|uniref:UBC core domain-containing protein n=1 Tax=Tritrichomonas foetus TaxID=1144522 RepID=A0A1J4KQA5_9EUKA|nr:hypothetical protein TRFO_18352 [Tritrichomonas foetus]|eukprot:OHT11972.1 hypothetical protein TRFO_18352 [Tritrichomonas foetus]
MHQVPSASRRDFQRIIEEGYECCRKHHSDSWILEPVEEVVGVFNGIIFAKADDEIPGAAFSFTLYIDPQNLADQPRVQFDKNLEHPYILPSPTGSGGLFCFPTAGISCREKMNVILDNLSKSFFFKKVSGAVNPAAETKLRKNPKAFWAKLFSDGALGSNSPQ